MSDEAKFYRIKSGDSYLVGVSDDLISFAPCKSVSIVLSESSAKVFVEKLSYYVFGVELEPATFAEWIEATIAN